MDGTDMTAGYTMQPPFEMGKGHKRGFSAMRVHDILDLPTGGVGFNNG